MVRSHRTRYLSIALASYVQNLVSFDPLVNWEKGVFELNDSKILFFLLKEKTACYTDLLRHLRSSRSTLASALRQLQALGLVSRAVKDTRPIQTQYSLTQNGQKFAEQLLDLRRTLERSTKTIP